MIILLTHPNNEKLIRQALKKYYDPLSAPKNSLNVFSSVNFQLRTNIFMKERNIEERWSPPESDKFCEYEESDQEWMRPLRIGIFTYEDVGPLIYLIDEQFFKPVDLKYNYLPSVDFSPTITNYL